MHVKVLLGLWSKHAKVRKDHMQIHPVTFILCPSF